MINNKGAALIELSLVFPLLAIVLFGIIEFGLMIYDQAMITNASREGARAGIVMATPKMSEPDIIKIVEDYCKNHLITFRHSTTTGPSLAVTVDGEGGAFGNNLTVTTTYKYEFLVIPHIVTDVIGGPITLTSRSVMRME